MKTWHVAIRDPGSAHWSHTSSVIPQYEVRYGWRLWLIPYPVEFLRRPRAAEKKAKKQVETLVKSLRDEFDVLVTCEEITSDGRSSESAYHPKD